MQPHDRAAFLGALNGLAAMKPGAKLSPDVLELWWQALSHWPIAEFLAAASHLARSCEFMPSPFHFERLRKAGRLTAGEAWALALEHARGAWRDGLHAEASVNAAASALGGFRVIAMSTESGLPFLERRFAEHFDALEGVAEAREMLPQIPSAGAGRAINGPRRVSELLPPRVRS